MKPTASLQSSASFSSSPSRSLSQPASRVFALNLGNSVSDTNLGQSSVGIVASTADDGTVTVQVLSGTAPELQLVAGDQSTSLLNPSPGDTTSITPPSGEDVTILTTTTGGQKNLVTTYSPPPSFSSTPEDVTNGREIHYKFDGDATNSVGPDGTSYGGISYEPGKVGQAATLDGSTTYIDTNTQPFTAQQGYTVTGWIKLDSTTGQNHIFGAYDGSRAVEFTTREYSDGSYEPAWFTWTSGSGTNGININSGDQSNLPVTSDQWYFIALTYDPSTGYTMHVNINAKYTSPNTDWTPPSNDLYIAAHNNNGGPSSNFDGNIDDLRIYTRTLSDDELDRVFGQGS